MIRIKWDYLGYNVSNIGNTSWETVAWATVLTWINAPESKPDSLNENPCLPMKKVRTFMEYLVNNIKIPSGINKNSVLNQLFNTTARPERCANTHLPEDCVVEQICMDHLLKSAYFIRR